MRFVGNIRRLAIAGLLALAVAVASLSIGTVRDARSSDPGDSPAPVTYLDLG